ncbi:MAG TPA: OmpH family outer membrane protein [Anaeromyxobacteraceae bacterium]|jgi:outer membrane protein|nr:OmpH family outer membrane protein [Anaeromyxobacteraceae bacterium]
MRRLATTAALAFAAALYAAPAAADVKIGFVDLQRALNEVEDGKIAKTQLKKEFDAKQKTLDEKQEDLKRMKADYDKQSVVMSDAAKKEKQGEFDRKFVDVQNTYVQLQKELSEREREMTRGIFEKMNAIIREMAEQEGFTMVFEKTDSGLIYAPPQYDLTNELVRKYNARHKGSAPAAKKSNGKKK